MRTRRCGGLVVAALVASTLLGGCSPSDNSDIVSELQQEIAALPIVKTVEMNYLIDGFPAAAHWNPDVTLREDASPDQIEQTGMQIVELYRSYRDLSDLGLDIDLTWREARMYGDIGSLAPEEGGAAWRFFARIAERPYIPSLNVSLRGASDGVHMLVMIHLQVSDFAAVTPVFVMLREDFPDEPPQVNWRVEVDGGAFYQSNDGLPSPAQLDAGLQRNDRNPRPQYTPFIPTPSIPAPTS